MFFEDVARPPGPRRFSSAIAAARALEGHRREPLARHRERLRLLHETDRKLGLAGVWMPDARDLEDRDAGVELAWPRFFSARSPGRDPRTGLRRRHHLHDNTVHLRVNAAARLAGIDTPVSCHTLRHASAMHLHAYGVGFRRREMIFLSG